MSPARKNLTLWVDKSLDSLPAAGVFPSLQEALGALAALSLPRTRVRINVAAGEYPEDVDLNTSGHEVEIIGGQTIDELTYLSLAKIGLSSLSPPAQDPEP